MGTKEPTNVLLIKETAGSWQIESPRYQSHHLHHTTGWTGSSYGFLRLNKAIGLEPPLSSFFQKVSMIQTGSKNTDLGQDVNITFLQKEALLISLSRQAMNIASW